MRTLRASKENPCAYGKQGVESRECQKQVRKHTGYCQGYEHGRDEYQSVDNRSGDDLSCAGTASENVKPADYHDRETDHAHEVLPHAQQKRNPEKEFG